MSLPLLTTKIHPPPVRPNRVPRPRLIARLNDVVVRPLTLISAPAGFGKTTLISEWGTNAGRDFSFAWLSLDEDDDAPVRFLTCLCATLDKAKSGVGQAAFSLLQNPQPLPQQYILTTLVNDLDASSSGPPIILVLDDYHALTASSIHDAIEFLVEHSPPSLRLILSTRADPPLPLARWRARDQLNEIRADDLRFMADETAAFLNQVMGLQLSADHITTLEARTEGWIAGLQLAALSLQRHADVNGFIANFAGSHRYVLDYLTEEVWRCQPAVIQDFLLKTSILERLCGPLCEAVLNDESTHEASGAAVLEELERANLFLFPLDAERRWDRYHHLWAGAMQAQLQRTAPDLIFVLHQRASLWHEQANDMDGAIRHALAARNFERAAHLIEKRTAWWVRNEVGTLTRWLAALPEAVIRARPRLLFNQVWNRLSNSKADEAEAWLRDIDEELHPQLVPQTWRAQRARSRGPRPRAQTYRLTRFAKPHIYR